MAIFGFFFLTIFSIISLKAFFGLILKKRRMFRNDIELKILLAFLTLATMGFVTLWIDKKTSFVTNLSILLVINVYVLFRVNWKVRDYLKELIPTNLVAPMFSWILLGSIACTASSMNFDPPSNLPDGPYVYKTWTKNVQVQWASGDMPADNALPYFAGEFLIRKVDLREIHPFAPGQEIVLRTFLVPFIYLTFRSFDLNAARDPSITYFNYVGSSWPNAMDFYSPNLYEIYTGVNIALQGFLVFAILIVAGRTKKLWKQGFPAAIFLAFFPFIFQQTYFTWTKSLCVAFALLSIRAIIEKNFWLSGFLIALCYQVHPMALIFFLAISIYMLLKEKQNFHKIWIPFGASYTAWQIWVKSTNLNSDLIQQNLFIDQSIAMHLFARFGTMFNYVSPSFLNSYPPDIRNVANSWMISGFPIALTFLFSIALSMKFSIKYAIDESTLFTIGFISLIISILVLSKPSMVIFFGGQLFLAIVLVVAIKYASSWRVYIPWFVILSLGSYIWVKAVTLN